MDRMLGTSKLIASLVLRSAALGLLGAQLWPMGMRTLLCLPLILLFFLGSERWVLLCALWLGLCAWVAPPIRSIGDLALLGAPAFLAVAFHVFDRLTEQRDAYGAWLRRHGGVWRWACLVGVFLMALLLLARPVSLWIPVAAMVTLLLARSELPVDAPRSWRSWLSLMGSVAYAVFLFVAVLEVGARLVSERPVPRNDNVFTVHPKNGFSLNKDATATLSIQSSGDEWTPFKVVLSRQGLRDREYGPKQDEEYRVFILGDSYAMGWGLSQDGTLSRVLERRLRGVFPHRRISVINGGCGAYGPWEERNFLLERGFPLEPDLVIHQLFPGNDIENELARLDKYPQAYNRDAQAFYLRWRDKGHFPVKAERWSRKHLAFYRLFLRASGNRSVVQDLFSNLRFVERYESPALPLSAERPFNLEVCLREWYPELELGWRMFEEDVLEVRDDCRRRGVDYAAFCIPEPFDVLDTQWRWGSADLGPEKYERYKDVRLCHAFCEREAIPYIGLGQPMRECSYRNDLYYESDGHLSPLGTAFVAELLAEYLIRHYLDGPAVPDSTIQPAREGVAMVDSEN